MTRLLSCHTVRRSAGWPDCKEQLVLRQDALLAKIGKVRIVSRGSGEMRRVGCVLAHHPMCGVLKHTLQQPQFFASDRRLRRLRIILPKVVPVTFRSEKQLLMQLFSAYRPSILLPNAVRVDGKGLRRRTSRSCTASYAPF